MFRQFLLALTSIWFFAVIGFYYYYHPHYVQLIGATGLYAKKAVVALVALIIWYVIKTWKGRKLKVSVAGIILAFSLFSVIQIQWLNYLEGPVRYIGPTIIRDQAAPQKIRFMKPKEVVNDPRLIVLQPNQLILETKPLEVLVKDGNRDKIFQPFSVVDTTLSIIKNYSIAVGPILLTILLAYIIGFHLQLKYINRKQPEEGSAVMAIAIGYTVIFSVSFILAWLGVFTAHAVWIFTAIAIVLCLKSLKQVGKNLITGHEINFKPHSILGLMIVFALFSSVHYLLATFHDVPVGLDGARLYLKIVYDLIRLGTLPPGYPPYFGEIIYGFASLLTTSTVQAAMFIPVAHVILACAAMYQFAKNHLNSQPSVIITVLIYMASISMTLFLTVLDHKTEYFSLFFCIVSVSSLLTWMKNKQWKDLIWAALFAGIAFASKMTFIILILGSVTLIAMHYFKRCGAIAGIALSLMVIVESGNLKLPGIEMTSQLKMALLGVLGLLALAAIIGAVIKHRKKLSTGLKSIIVFSMIVAIPLMPWLAVHYTEVDTPSISGLLFGQKKTLDDVALTEGYQCTIQQQAFSLDYGRYFDYKNTGVANLLTNYVKLPWEITMNSLNPNSNTTDIGFMLMAFLPLLAALYWRKKKSENVRAVAILSALMWFFWIFMSPGVTWYAMAAFGTSMTLIMALWPNMRTDKVAAAVLMIVTAASIFLMSNYHALRIEKIFLATATGLMDQDEFYKISFPGYPQIISVLSDEDSIVRRGAYVLKAGGSMEYFMKRGYEIVFSDNYFDFFECGLKKHNGDADAFIQVMQDRGIKYVFLSKALFNEPRKTIRERYIRAYQSMRPHMKAYVDSDKIFFGKFN